MANLKQKRARIYKDFDLAFGNNAITGDINKKLDKITNIDSDAWIIELEDKKEEFLNLKGET